MISSLVIHVINKELHPRYQYSKKPIGFDLINRDIITHYPPILAISCVFTTSNQSSSILEKVYHLFTSSSFSSYSLHAFVYYHYYHYVSICLEGNNMTSCWVEYNDNQRTIFHSTEEMIDHCIQSMALPVLLFYSIVFLILFSYHSVESI